MIPEGPEEWLDFVDLPRSAYVARIRNHMERISEAVDRDAERDAVAADLIRTVGGIPPTDEPDTVERTNRAAVEAVTNRLQSIAGRAADPAGVDTSQLRRDAIFVEVVAGEVEDIVK